MLNEHKNTIYQKLCGITKSNLEKRKSIKQKANLFKKLRKLITYWKTDEN
jgi:hypothetical protein